MKRFVLLVIALSVVFFGAARVFADVKSGSTTQTRDIMLVEEKETGSSSPGQTNPSSDPGVINVQELHKNDFVTALTASSQNGVYKPGDKISLTFTSEKDAYLTILDFTPTGNIVVLYPNDLMKGKDNFVKAGEPVVIPVSGDGYALIAGDRVGVDVVKAIATTDKDKRIYDKEGGNVVLAPPFSALKDTVSATRDILLVIDDEGTNTPNVPASEWSVASCAIMTDNGDGKPNGFAVSADGKTKIWTNGYRYLVGERVFVQILSEKAGKFVSLVNAGASSAENAMLPASAEVAFEAGQLLVLPRPDDKWKLVAAEKSGNDGIKAKIAYADGAEEELSLNVTVEQDDGE